jgi:hypothetical protein
MSTLWLQPTWLVPEARWQRTGLFQADDLSNGKARVNITTKNKFPFPEYSPQLLAASGNIIKRKKTNTLFILMAVYVRTTTVSHTIRTTHLQISTRDFRRLGNTHALPPTCNQTQTPLVINPLHSAAASHTNLTLIYTKKKYFAIKQISTHR